MADDHMQSLVILCWIYARGIDHLQKFQLFITTQLALQQKGFTQGHHFSFCFSTKVVVFARSLQFLFQFLTLSWCWHSGFGLSLAKVSPQAWVTWTGLFWCWCWSLCPSPTMHNPLFIGNASPLEHSVFLVTPPRLFLWKGIIYFDYALRCHNTQIKMLSLLVVTPGFLISQDCNCCKLLIWMGQFSCSCPVCCEFHWVSGPCHPTITFSMYVWWTSLGICHNGVPWQVRTLLDGFLQNRERHAECIEMHF